MLDRIANEPVLISAAVIAVGNALGHDLTAFEAAIQSVVVVVVGLITRHFVSPTRSL
jgi:hypothetical protein